MKKQFLNIATIKVYATAALVSLVMLGAATQANAAEKTVKGDNEANITYVGTENSLMAFNVAYANEAGESFVLELTDDNGNLLYQKKFSGKNFNKNILIKNVGEEVKVNFVIRTAKNSLSQTFDIGTQTRTIEEIVVTKL